MKIKAGRVENLIYFKIQTHNSKKNYLCQNLEGEFCENQKLSPQL